MSRPATESSGKRRTRRSAEATRELMLRAGEKLAIDRLATADEDAASRALAHIRLTEVAQVATELEASERGHNGRITTGAIYQFWPSQAAFQADLMVHILTESPLPVQDRLASRALELIAAGTAVEEVLAELADLAYSVARNTVSYDLSLLFVPYSRLPRVGEALHSVYRDQADASRPIYQALLSAGGLKVRAPWQLEDMMTAISALHDGYRIQDHSRAHSVRTRRRHSVVAEATVAIFRAFTEPA